jgi:hypothetical protein
MALDLQRIQDVMRYAVAVAANQDDARQRELGPIHLLKYAYLADLAYAENEGRTYTGCGWRFHHFGPYASEAWKQIEPAMEVAGIQSRDFDSRYQDDVRRYRSYEPTMEDEIESRLPAVVARRIRRLVAEFGNDTPALLHFVYRTPPMLNATPQEALDFGHSVREVHQVKATSKSTAEHLSKTAKKKKDQAHDELKARFQQALASQLDRKGGGESTRPPRYDKVFEQGTAWLDELAGGKIEPLQGEVRISDGIWKSKTRTEPGIP